MSFELNHISISQLNTFGRCEYQWALRYIRGLKIPTNVNMVTGTGGHAGFESIYRQKKTYDKYNLDEALDATRDAIEYADVKEEVDWETPKTEVKDNTVKLVRAYSQMRFPDKIENQSIEGIELPLRIKLKRKETIVAVEARADLALQNKVVELKTAARTPTAVDANVVLQAYTYAIALGKHQTDIHYMIKKKEPTAIEFPCNPIDENFLVVVQNSIVDFWENLQAKIKSGNFMATGVFHPYACKSCGYGLHGYCKHYKLGQ